MTKNERMKQLLESGDVLKAGIARGDVMVVILPKQSKTNDVKMRKLSGILYGGTKYTDEQILYFYNKHNGNATAAARDLRMWPVNYKIRLNRLGLRPKGVNPAKFTDKQIIAAYNKHNGHKEKASFELGMSYTALRLRLIKLKLIVPGGPSGKTKSFTDKEFKKAMALANGNKTEAALLLKCNLSTVYSRLKELKAKQKLSQKKR